MKESVPSNEDFTNIYNKHSEEIKNLNMKKMEKNFEKTVTNMNEIDYLRRIYTNSILRMTEIDCSSISTENCEMCCMFIGDNIYSGAYGQIKGCFRYKDNRLFGLEAFLNYMSYDSLTGNDDKDLRLLMNSIKSFVVKEELCKKIRKMDKKYLELKGRI